MTIQTASMSQPTIGDSDHVSTRSQIVRATRRSSRPHRWAYLVGAILISFVPGVVGSLFPADAWYASVEKSPLTPPGIVFPIVWTTLYLLMGVALWLFWQSSAPRAALRRGTALFGVQLVFNGLWSYLFFGLHRPDLALVDIGLLWLSIVSVMAAFAAHRRAAAIVLAPYLLWVSFASYLNYAVWHLL